MQNFPVMDMFYCQAYLSKPVQNLILSKRCLIYIFLFCFNLFMNSWLQISALCIIHDNAQLFIFSFIDISKFYNVWMGKNLENHAFFDNHFTFFVWDLRDVYLLDHCYWFVWFAFYLKFFAEWTFSDCFYLFLWFILFFLFFILLAFFHLIFLIILFYSF